MTELIEQPKKKKEVDPTPRKELIENPRTPEQWELIHTKGKYGLRRGLTEEERLNE